MGGPRRIILAIIWALVVLAILLVLWFSSLTPDVREYILDGILHLS